MTACRSMSVTSSMAARTRCRTAKRFRSPGGTMADDSDESSSAVLGSAPTSRTAASAVVDAAAAGAAAAGPGASHLPEGPKGCTSSRSASRLPAAPRRGPQPGAWGVGEGVGRTAATGASSCASAGGCHQKLTPMVPGPLSTWTREKRGWKWLTHLTLLVMGVVHLGAGRRGGGGSETAQQVRCCTGAP